MNDLFCEWCFSNPAEVILYFIDPHASKTIRSTNCCSVCAISNPGLLDDYLAATPERATHNYLTRLLTGGDDRETV